MSNQLKDEPGLRYDAGKLRFDLIPPDALEALAKVYTVGAAKYADRNWEKGMSWGRVFGSLMRHSWAFWRGEEIDEETDCHHMALAAWNCFALFRYSTRGVGTDDRLVAYSPSDAVSLVPEAIRIVDKEDLAAEGMSAAALAKRFAPKD